MLSAKGASGAAPQEITGDLALEDSNNNQVQFAADGEDRVVAVWYHIRDGVQALWSNSSLDGGETWRTPVRLPSAGNAHLPDVATDGAGTWMAVWEDYSEGIRGAVSTDVGATWSPPFAVDADADWPGSMASIATDGAGTWIVAYGLENGSACRRSTDGGGTWTPAEMPGDSTAPQLATDGHGNWIALSRTVPVPFDEEKLYVRRSSDNGETWSVHQLIAHTFRGDRLATGFRPALAISPANGRAMIVWNHGNSADVDLYFVQSHDQGGTWSQPVKLPEIAPDEEFADLGPSVAATQDGRWLVVWQSNDFVEPVDRPGTVIYYTASSDNGLNWSAPLPVSETLPYNPQEAAENWTACAGMGAYGWIAGWSAYYLPRLDGKEEAVLATALNPGITIGKAVISDPRDGNCVAGNRVLVSADIEPPDGVVDSVRFEIQRDGEVDWSLLDPAQAGFPNPDTTAPYFVHLNADALDEATYRLRAVADYGGTEDANPEFITVTVDDSCGSRQFVTASNEAGATTQVAAGTEARVAVGALTSEAIADLSVSSGQLPDASVVGLEFVGADEAVRAWSAGPVGAVFDVTLTGAGDTLSFAGTVEVRCAPKPGGQYLLLKLVESEWQVVPGSASPARAGRVTATIDGPGRYALGAAGVPPGALAFQ